MNTYEAHTLAKQTIQDPTIPRVLCLWLPNWPIQRLVVSEPELRWQRIVLYRQDPRRGQLVAAVSPLAKQDGIAIGMPLSEAKSLLKRTSQQRKNGPSGGPPKQPQPHPTAGKTQSPPPHPADFHIFELSPSSDQETLEQLADSLESFSPIIGLEPIEPAEQKKGQQPNSVFLDVTGLAHLFGTEHQLACQLYRHCDQLGYLPRIAIANTIGAAWGAARFLRGRRDPESGHPSTSPRKTLSANPAGSPKSTENTAPLPLNDWQSQQIVILPPDDQHTFSQLPIEALRLQPATTQTLHQLGIKTIQQVQLLPRPDLAMRFGTEIHRRIDQANGQIEEPVIARYRPPDFQAEQLLEYPTNHRETIEVITGRLVTEICKQMRNQQRGALQWTIELDCQNRDPITFQISLFQATSTRSDIMPLIEMQLEQVLKPHTRKSRKRTRRTAGNPTNSNPTNRPDSLTNPSQPATGKPSTNNPTAKETTAEYQFHRYTTIQVQEISVRVTSCVLLVQQQRQLFDENPRLDKQALAHLINRLSNRLGQANVVYPTLQSGAQPEHAFRLRPLIDIRRKRSRKPTKPPRQSHVFGRPLRLFSPTEIVESGKLEVESGKWKVESGRPPALLRIGGLQRDGNDVTVVRHWGPERIETGWWRGQTVCRDYWRIETKTGQQFWIFQDLRSKNWFLQGQF